MVPRKSGRVTIEDVAARAGVSRAAVSKVLNGRKGISEATAARIRAAAEDLQWSPSAAASALRSARSRTVAMVMRRNTDLLVVDPHFAVLVSGAEQVLAPLGYGLQMHLVGESDEAEARVYRMLAEQRRVDGVIAPEIRVDDPRPALFAELGLPAVFLGVPADAARSDTVRASAPESGLIEAADHLVGLGHRHVAYVSGPDDRVHTGFRRTVFVEALARRGLALSHDVSVDFTEEAAAAAADRLMRLDVPPSAIVFANDTMAIAAIGVLQKAGLSVPGDVSVVGHDDLAFGSWIHPGLTTISQDLQTIAAAGASRLVAQLGERDVTEPVVRNPRLVVRGSTGPAAPRPR